MRLTLSETFFFLPNFCTRQRRCGSIQSDCWTPLPRIRVDWTLVIILTIDGVSRPAWNRRVVCDNFGHYGPSNCIFATVQNNFLHSVTSKLGCDGRCRITSWKPLFTEVKQIAQANNHDERHQERVPYPVTVFYRACVVGLQYALKQACPWYWALIISLHSLVILGVRLQWQSYPRKCRSSFFDIALDPIWPWCRFCLQQASDALSRLVTLTLESPKFEAAIF